MENLHENERSRVAGRIFKFLSSVVSDVGVKRTENQDAFSVSHSRDVSLFLVADGMGGAKGGATASTLAASIVGAEAFKQDGSIDVDSFRRVIEQANLAIHARSVRDKDLKGMGTTIAAIAFVDDRVLVSSVGDSRVYFLRGADFKQLTRDHTLVQELVENGAIKLEDAATHPISHMLTRSLGPVDKVNVDTFEFSQRVEISDRFLICSDGLYNHVKPEELKEIMAEGKPRDVNQKLLKMALERGGSDNITIQVIEVSALNDSSFVFPLPAPGKIEINLLGRIEQREIGSEEGELVEDDSRVDEFDFSELISDCETPSGVGTPVVLSESSGFNKLYIGGALLTALIAIVLFSKGGGQQSAENPFSVKTKINKTEEKKPQEPETAKPQTEVAVAATQEKVEQVASEVVQVESQKPVEQTVQKQESPLTQQQAEPVSAEVMNKVLDRANSLEVPEAPKVKVELPQNPPDQPIVWENEERKLSKLKQLESQPAEQKQEEQELQEDKEELSKSIYRGGEGVAFAGVLEEKRELRKKIADLDFKLQLLEDGFKEQQQGKLAQEAEESKVVLTAIDGKLLALENDLSSWKGFDRIYDQNTMIDFLQKKSANSESLNKLLQEYKKLDQNYRDAVKLWQQNPRELSLASEMGAKARQKEEFFKSIQQTAKSNIAFEVNKILSQYAEQLIEKRNTEEMLESINRRKGFLESAFKLDPTRTAGMKEQYLAERDKFVAKVEKDKRKLPDERELELHKNILVSELKTKL